MQDAADTASPEAAHALEEICQSYWFPLYAYIRRRGCTAEDAEDLTQDFFQQLLTHRWLKDVDRTKGKLRAFLITALKRFMANEWRRASAQKRGGGAHPLSLDSRIAESRYAASGHSPLEAEALYDRQWALTLLDLTLQKLENEYTVAGKKELFRALKSGLVMAREALNYSALAEQLDMTEGAVRVAVHRLRKRFRELYRNEVVQTLPVGADLEDELRHLAQSLASG